LHVRFYEVVDTIAPDVTLTAGDAFEFTSSAPGALRMPT
jgi:hypothetical protein